MIASGPAALKSSLASLSAPAGVARLFHMDADHARTVALRAILVSTDRDHADLVRACLGIASSPFDIEQVSPQDLLASDLAARIAATSARAPTLVILDFDSMPTSCESMAARIMEQRDGRPVECLITRAALDPLAVERLRGLGVFFFAERHPPAEDDRSDQQAASRQWSRPELRVLPAAPARGASRRKGD